MKRYAMSIKAEFTAVRQGFQYRIALSPTLGSARVELGELAGVRLGYPDDPATVSIRNLTVSERGVGFVAAADAERLVLTFSISATSPIVFGHVDMPDATLLTLSNRDTGMNLWGGSVWVLPVNYWESPAIKALVDAEPAREPPVVLEPPRPPKTT